MAIFTTGQKQQMFLAALPVVAALVVIGVLYEYWYITVPIGVVVIGIAVAVWVSRRPSKEMKSAIQARYVEDHTHVPRIRRDADPLDVESARPEGAASDEQ